MIDLLDRWTARISAHRWMTRALASVERWERASDEFLAKRWRFACCAAVVLFVQAALIWSHVPWRDEWQALQIAVEVPDLRALLAALRFEGHPPLWYLLLRSLAGAIGTSYALPAAATICALPAQTAVLARAPFSRTVRLLLACSVFTLFEFYTISRSLTLGVACAFGVMLTWRSGWRWLFIAMLPQCDFIFGLLSLAFVALSWRERRLPLAGVAVWLASALAAAVTVIPDPAFVPDTPPVPLAQSAGQFINALGILLVPLQWEKGPLWNASLPVLLVPFGWFGAVLFFRDQLRGDPFAGWTLALFLAVLGALSISVYPLGNRHVMVAAVLFIGLIWLRNRDGGDPGRAFVAWLSVSAAIGVLVAAYSAAVPFDSAPRFAAEIEKRGLVDKPWVTLSAAQGQPITALTGMRFEHLEKQCRQTFVKWNYRPRLDSRRKLYAYLARSGVKRGNYWLLSPYRLRHLPADTGKLRFMVAGGYNGQYYFAYEVAPGLPELRRIAPNCQPGLRQFAPAKSSI